MTIESLLSLMGVPQKPATIYTTLLEHGAATIADIVRESGMHRPDVYKYLPYLEHRGLVTPRTVGKRRCYAATSPEHMLGDIDSIKNSIDEAATHLRVAYQSQSSRPKVEYYEGSVGMKRIIGDVTSTLKKGEAYYRYGSRKSSTNIKRFQPANFKEVRDKKQLERYVITSAERARTYDNDMNRLVKTVPGKVLFDDNVQLMIYGDKISIIDFESETGIIIEHTKLASFQRKLFRLLFDRL